MGLILIIANFYFWYAALAGMIVGKAALFAMKVAG